MTAITTDVDRAEYDGSQAGFPVAASTKIVMGAGVALNASGYAVNAADTAGLKAIGVCVVSADNTSGANGDLSVSVRWDRQFLVATASDLTQAALGTELYWTDNNTVGDAGDSTHKVYAGTLAKYVSASSCRLLVGKPDTKINAGGLKSAVIAGGAAGTHTVTGITTADTLVSVVQLDRNATAANITIADLTSEFSITDADELTNTTTNTTGDALLVLYVSHA